VQVSNGKHEMPESREISFAVVQFIYTNTHIRYNKEQEVVRKTVKMSN
jgi:hypothetical protein